MPRYIPLIQDFFITCLNCDGDSFVGGKTLEESFCEDCGAKPYFIISAENMRKVTGMRFGRK